MSDKLLLVDKTESKSSFKALRLTCEVFAGTLFLVLMSQIAIYLPFSSIPMTLQTLAVSLLALSLGRNKALYALLLYVIEATLGFPVLKGGTINPLWMIGPTAGYIFGFFASAYIIGTYVTKSSSLIKKMSIIFTAELIILLSGTFWLSILFNPTIAFTMGFLPFFAGAITKSIVATTSIAPLEWIKDKLS